MRNSGVAFAVVRPCALTEEDAGAEAQLDQGDTIKATIRPLPVLAVAVAVNRTCCE